MSKRSVYGCISHACNWLCILHRTNPDGLQRSSYPRLYLNGIGSGELVAVDQQGTVKILETTHASLERCVCVGGEALVREII